MKSYAIVIKDNPVSEQGFKTLIDSSMSAGNTFDIQRFDAVTPDTVKNVIEYCNIKWTWPHTGTLFDKATGIKKIGYGGADPLRRKACGMSHYLLWKQCAETQTPLLIFEHDALFIHRLDPQYLLDSEYDIIGLNDPRGATRLANKFHGILQSSNQKILPAPEIDKEEIAQGIAGNSAYMIKPNAAQRLLDLVDEHGMWNNDAIMCRQLMPNMIGVTNTYYTKIQGLKSTTMR